MAIQKIKYKDWYINNKNVPTDPDGPNYEIFWDSEEERCKEGITIDGVYFPGKLYWHLNYWHVEVDTKDASGKISQEFNKPPLRDIEWVFFNELEKAETGNGEGKGQKGLAIGGCRRLGKSYLLSSYLAHGVTFDRGSENVLVGVNSQDIKVTTNKIKKGLQLIPKCWKWTMLNKDWKSQVDFGIEEKDGEKTVFSHLMFRNLDGGNNSEILAGLKPRKLALEEIAKGDFLSGLQAATPSFSTPYGATCSPLAIFTGGDVEKGKDAKELFFSPDAYNFMAYDDDKVVGRKTGLFLGNKWRMDAKVETTLDRYLGIESKELAKIKIQVSDPEKAERILVETLELKAKSADRNAYYKEQMYYPRDVDDIFLNTMVSIFNTQIVKAQIDRIEVYEIKGTYVELYEDENGKVKHRLSKKLPISNFPVEPGDDKDAPIVIFEFPQHDPPAGLHVAGIDSYRQGQAYYSTSLGSIFIFKRMHDINSNTFQDMFVASYAARPEDKKVWDEQTRLLIKYYNAIAMVENDEISFIDYMISKHEDHYLADTPDWFKLLQPNSKQKRNKGLSRASKAVINYLHGVYKNYMEEEIIPEKKDENGEIVQKRILGVSRILDVMLLKETLEYYDGGNFDRVVSAEIALAYAKKLDPLYGIIGKKVSAGEALKMRSEKREPRKMFSTSRSFYGGRKRKSLFR